MNSLNEFSEISNKTFNPKGKFQNDKLYILSSAGSLRQTQI